MEVLNLLLVVVVIMSLFVMAVRAPDASFLPSGEKRTTFTAHWWSVRSSRQSKAPPGREEGRQGHTGATEWRGFVCLPERAASRVHRRTLPLGGVLASMPPVANTLLGRRCQAGAGWAVRGMAYLGCMSTLNTGSALPFSWPTMQRLLFRQ